MTRKRSGGVSRRCAMLAAAAVLLAAGTASAGWFGLGGSSDTGPVYTGLVEGVAVGGYDPVAYFTQGRPVKGRAEIAAEYRGATWRFASTANRETFLAEPEKYAPAYGGYCAWAIAQGKLSKGDPNNWDIVEGRLYLNYNGNIQARWRKDAAGFIGKAETHWPGLTAGN